MQQNADRELMNSELEDLASLVQGNEDIHMRRLIQAWMLKTCGIWLDENLQIYESQSMRQCFLYQSLGPKLFQRGVEKVRIIREVLLHYYVKTLEAADQDVHAAEEKGNHSRYIYL